MTMLPSWQAKKHKVKKLMQPPTWTVAPSTPAADAYSLMQEKRVRHLLVMKDGALVGVVTDRDLLQPKRTGSPFTVQELFVVDRDLTVLGLMTTKLITVEEDDNVAYASRLMIDNQVSCLPVMRKERVMGILTSTDLIRAFAEAVDPQGAEPARSA